MGKLPAHRMRCDFCGKIVDVKDATNWQPYAMIDPMDTWYEVWACEDCTGNPKKRKESYRNNNHS